MFKKPELLFKTDRAPNLHEFIGRTVVIPEFANINGKKIQVGREVVTIATIVGGKMKPQFYEINGKHHVGILRFLAQMNGAKDVTEDEMHAFEEMEFEVVDPRKDKDERTVKEVKTESGSPTQH